MARNQMTGGELPQGRRLFMATGHRMWAPSGKWTAWGELEGRGELALQEGARAFLLDLGIGNGDRGEKRLGIGMQGLGVEIFGGSDFDEVAEVHHGNSIGDVLDHG